MSNFIKSVFYHVGLVALGMLLAAYYMQGDFIKGFNYALKHAQIERVVVR